jgi:hypothetical protein
MMNAQLGGDGGGQHSDPIKHPEKKHFTFDFAQAAAAALPGAVNALVRSCPLPKFMVVEQEKEREQLVVQASAVMPLSSYLHQFKNGRGRLHKIVHMPYDAVLRMIYYIGAQLHALDNAGFGVPYFHLNDVLVFFDQPPNPDHDASSDHVYFAFMNPGKLVEFVDYGAGLHHPDVAAHDEDDEGEGDDEEQEEEPEEEQEEQEEKDDAEDENGYEDSDLLEVLSPLIEHYDFHSKGSGKNEMFVSPEVAMVMKSLPFRVHYKAAFYSFGLLCVHCLLGGNAAIDVTKKEALDAIYGTQVYWFLQRVFSAEPSERRFICS